MSANGKLPFLLANATLTLYRTTASGAPITTSPVWFGSCEESLKISERWITAESFPAGRKYPRRRALIQQYQIAINRLWVQQMAAMGDFTSSHETYVLDIRWDDDDGAGFWHRKTFYEVTISERSWNSSEVFEMRDEQVFNSAYYTEDSGSGAVPIIAASIPLSIQWVGSDAVLTLYTYSASTNAFTQVGTVTGRATVAYVPDQSGDFVVTFDGGLVALQVSGEQTHVGELIEGSPGLSAVPRLDFMVGNSRVASITVDGKFYSFLFTEENEPTEGANTFRVQAGSDTVLVIGATGARSDEFVEDL